MTDTFTLVEFYEKVQRTDDGHPYWEEPSCDINGELMVFDTVEDAAGMARFILGSDGNGPEREPRSEHAPLIGVLVHNFDARGDEPDDPESWSYGWVDIDGKLHEGDYENDPDHWRTNPVRVA